MAKATRGAKLIDAQMVSDMGRQKDSTGEDDAQDGNSHGEKNHSGPQWGQTTDDLNLTLLEWTQGHTIAPHINAEVDVVLVGIEGSGEIRVGQQSFLLTAGQILLIPKGAERSLHCQSERWSYLSLHRRRAGLMPSANSFQPPSEP